jgi:hypothetical protein
MTDHDDGAATVIEAELARMILGGRGAHRCELRMDYIGQLARRSIAYRLLLLDVARRMKPAIQAIVRFASTLAESVELEQ